MHNHNKFSQILFVTNRAIQYCVILRVGASLNSLCELYASLRLHDTFELFLVQFLTMILSFSKSIGIV